jgi:hypothetical protein
VRYVPELKRNLLSLIMFGDLGYKTRFEHIIIEISSDSKIVCFTLVHAFVTSGDFHDVVEM